MAITMSKEVLIRIPQELYSRIKEVSAQEYKSMSAFIRETIKERVDEILSAQDMADIQATRKEFKSRKTVTWRSVKCG